MGRSKITLKKLKERRKVMGPYYENQDGTYVEVHEEEGHIICDDDGDIRDVSVEATEEKEENL